jgi:hypothetical protein
MVNGFAYCSVVISSNKTISKFGTDKKKKHFKVISKPKSLSIFVLGCFVVARIAEETNEFLTLIL